MAREATPLRPGNTRITYTAGADIAAGAVVPLTSFCGVADSAIANTAVGLLIMDGEFAVTTAASEAWTGGAKVYWDDTNNVATTTATSNTFLGIASAPKASTSTAGKVYLGFGA